VSDGGHGGKKRRGHEEEHEEHENHERWLVSYADMMTLLMVLFIVMFAISQVDQKKFAALKTGLSAGFGAPVAILSGGDQLLDPGGAVAPDSVNLAGAAGAKVPSAAVDPASAVQPEKVARLAAAQERAAVSREVEKLTEAEKELKKALKAAGLDKGATFRFDERGLVVTIATDDVLFESGSATLRPTGRRILDALSPVLSKLPNRLSVDGHTNDIPIHTAQFPSNWELSTDRATGVLRYLHSARGLPFGRMSATGFAETRPLLAASNPKAVSANRRVEIVVVARIDDAAGRAIAELGNGATAAAAKAAAAEAAAVKAAATKAAAAHAGTKADAGTAAHATEEHATEEHATEEDAGTDGH
jgi:chemotaxis protein MotB